MNASTGGVGVREFFVLLQLFCRSATTSKAVEKPCLSLTLVKETMAGTGLLTVGAKAAAGCAGLHALDCHPLLKA